MEISPEEEKELIGYDKEGPQVGMILINSPWPILKLSGERIYSFLFLAQEYEMNTWYYHIEDLTFETKFIQLTPEIIDALINASSYGSRNKPDSTSTSSVLESVSR